MKSIFIPAIIILVLFGCQRIEEKTNPLLEDVTSNIKIYQNLCDSFEVWKLNKLQSMSAELLYEYKLDSLLCLNKQKNRLITCRFLMVNIPESTSDDLQFIYGEKIDSNWIFFRGSSIVIPRSLIEGHDSHKPLSYQQLHRIALKEVYSGYIDQNGNINEKWFNAHFESSGWGGFVKPGRQDDPFLHGAICNTKKEYYEAVHLQSAKNNWVARDTTQPLVPLPVKNLP